MKSVLLNKKHYDGPGVYIGRPSQNINSNEHYGNPFSHQSKTKAEFVVGGGREEACRCYDWWIRGITGKNPAVGFALKDQKLIRRRNWIVRQLHAGALNGRALICWCAPELCHGHILIRLQQEALGLIRASDDTTERFLARFSPIHRCTICDINPVDTDAGYDTCQECIKTHI